MANATNLQDLVKNIVNGTLEERFCQICLMPLGENYQHINSRIRAEDKTYCVAEVLAQVCDIKVSDEVEYKICSNCVIAATQAYKFYLTAQKSQKIMDFYVNEINNQLHSIILDDLTSNSLCITLPIFLSNDGINLNQSSKISETRSAIYNLTEKETKEVKQEKAADAESDEDLIIVLNENGEQQYYKTQKDGTLILVENRDERIKCFLNLLDSVVKLNPDTDVKRSQSLDSNVNSSSSPDSSDKKRRERKRNLMEYKKCSQCPIQYRFVRKLKEHMKEEHSIDLFVCQVCQALVEGDTEFAAHVQTHAGIHMCSVCNMVFKKRETIISHVKWHEQMRAMTQSDAAHVCEVCGLIFVDGEDLKEHHDKTHVKKFTCYYCGRMYKGELSFDMHIKKHEMNVKQDQDKSKLDTLKKRKRKFKCGTCGKDFVDERALLWHERLHTNERPYACDVCGRGFVSLNRRNQHAVCAHTAPARRCPLCPALFHLRSMVNSHIKKVHLKAHKRPNRASRYQNVYWKTEPVPIQELSVSIQNDILELQAQRSRQELY